MGIYFNPNNKSFSRDRNYKIYKRKIKRILRKRRGNLLTFVSVSVTISLYKCVLLGRLYDK